MKTVAVVSSALLVIAAQVAAAADEHEGKPLQRPMPLCADYATLEPTQGRIFDCPEPSADISKAELVNGREAQYASAQTRVPDPSGMEITWRLDDF